MRSWWGPYVMYAAGVALGWLAGWRITHEGIRDRLAVLGMNLDELEEQARRKRWDAEHESSTPLDPKA